MKYQEGLKETKDFLKTTPEPQIREICNQAGLTERETEMIVQKFRKGKSRFHSSYDLGMSESRYVMDFIHKIQQCFKASTHLVHKFQIVVAKLTEILMRFAMKTQKTLVILCEQLKKMEMQQEL